MGDVALARQDFGQVLLAIAVDAGNAQHFSRPKLEADLTQRACPKIGLCLQVCHGQAWRAVAVNLAMTMGLTPVPDQAFGVAGIHRAGAKHHAYDGIGRVRLAHLLETLGRDVADQAAQAQNRNAVTELVGLFQLVGDQDQRDAFLAQPTHHLAEVVYSLGRQHRGRLVQDQHFLSTPERPHDLDLLLLSQGQAANQRVRINLDTQESGKLTQPFQSRSLTQALPPRPAKHQILDDRQARHQKHMLKDGADSEIEALAWRADDYRPAGNQDLALVGLLHAGKNADQSRLAGTVLAQQHMNLAGAELQRDALVGDHSRKPLGDVANGGDRR